ncbi:MAG: hypothetical protein H8E44_25535 [Planctomycetes bacterium]|nr:hypothetical protein [Planctomycetota bacterium]MBL7044766.1 hypothetical protein [Pirellulaceae bacterium]
MGTTALLIAVTFVAPTHTLSNDEIDKLDSTFQALWGTEFVWKFSDLPTKGNTPKHRVPYSGYYYPDKDGGTVSSLRKYDQAFHHGRQLATSHERWDSTAFKEPVPGLLGTLGVARTPEWYGHCNGWAAAAIRHAEPRTSVVRSGVVFSPSDIKGLLAELYVYNHHIMLGGANEEPISAAAFHAIITNWLGRKKHSLGIEVDPSEEKWNYPAFAYATSSAKRSARRVEVTMNVAYAENSYREWDESPIIKEIKFFHYLLDLNDKGEIIGGRFFRDSETIDMLWVPLRPKAAGVEGNERGNPYVDVDEVLAIWRDSVPEQIRRQWVTVDPAPEDEFEADSLVTSDVPLVTQVEADESETEPETARSDASPSPPRHFSVTEVTEDPLDLFMETLNR